MYLGSIVVLSGHHFGCRGRELGLRRAGIKKKDDFTRVYISTTLGNSDVGISKYAPNGSVSSFRPSETLESRAESQIWTKYGIRVYMTSFYKI